MSRGETRSGAWDELVEIVLAVGVPKAFRPKGARRQWVPHGAEWLDEARAEARRAVLEPATFARLVDHAEHAEHLWRRGQPGPDERTQVLGTELDGPRAWAEGTARAVRLWAEAAQEDERR